MSEIVRMHRAARAARFRTQNRRRNSFGFAVLCVAAFVVSAAAATLAIPHITSLVPAISAAVTPSQSNSVLVALPMCQSGRGNSCVIDGDTFRLDGQSIRIADIDTPETRNFQCDAEKRLGDQAAQRMRQLLNAGPFELEPYARDTDQYGRKLRIVTRNGQSLGQVLVGEGLARTWDGARHSWC